MPCFGFRVAAPAAGLRPPLPHLQRECSRRCQLCICTGTVPAAATFRSALGLQVWSFVQTGPGTYASVSDDRTFKVRSRSFGHTSPDAPRRRTRARTRTCTHACANPAHTHTSHTHNYEEQTLTHILAQLRAQDWGASVARVRRGRCGTRTRGTACARSTAPTRGSTTQRRVRACVRACVRVYAGRTSRRTSSGTVGCIGT